MNQKIKILSEKMTVSMKDRKRVRVRETQIVPVGSRENLLLQQVC